ncbi:hypothetical protein GCM10027280_04930 [Micromonospora polyrhachis]|uniref:Uncharacterized protein n=1 Tax=Micromonospora polyrhachis TaxID=1282883 RepID=A0A7W7WMG7_9ACTN|nr:hypothetical protein [Micromonospora polyrhachis]MBB4956597.1 hypothetical protein [Micromonospora polyrhachis]
MAGTALGGFSYKMTAGTCTPVLAELIEAAAEATIKLAPLPEPSEAA